MKTKIGALVTASLTLPLVSFAQTLSKFQTLVNQFGDIINTLLPIAFAAGLLVFFWGLIKYIFGSDHDKEAAKKTMLWGVIALFVMSSVWGLVKFIGDTFGVERVDTQRVPGVTR